MSVLISGVHTMTEHRSLVDGMISVHSLTDGEGLPTGPPGRESAAVLLTGTADWHGKSLRPGDGVFDPGGGDHGVRATTGGTRVLLVHGRGSRAGTPVQWHYLPATGETSGVLADAGGFRDMGVRWLVTTKTVGSARLVVATSTFDPGGAHARHRHPRAGEFFLVSEGSGEHLAPIGPIRMSAGDLMFVPAGEWHGFRTDPGVTTRAIYGYVGAGSLEQAGYEVDVNEVRA